MQVCHGQGKIRENKNVSRSVKSQGKSLILSKKRNVRELYFHCIQNSVSVSVVLKGSQEYFQEFFLFLQDNGSDHDRNRHPVDPSGAECTGRPTFHLHTSCQCIFLAANRSSISAFNPLDQSYRKGLYRIVPSRRCIGNN